MAAYTYHPALKAPGKTIDFDLSRPGTLVMLRLLVKTHLKQTDSFTPPAGLRMRRLELGNVPCFLIEPETEETLPGMLYCHGGAFYLPTQLPSLELACIYATEGHLRVILPEYRLVPEHPAPAALDDCTAVWGHMTDRAPQLGLDTARLLVYGESAGGALAAGLTLRIRDRGMAAPCGQLLVYPVLDNRSQNYPSAADYEEATWSARSNRSMWDAYLKQTDDSLLPYLAPMQAADLRNLPQAYIEPQQIDVLCDEAVAYGRRLQEDGIPAQLNLIAGSYHGFDSDLSSSLVQQVLAHRVAVMKKMLNIKEKEV